MRTSFALAATLLGAHFMVAPATAQCCNKYFAPAVAPDMRSGGYYTYNQAGQVYGPHYNVHPPFPPFQGAVMGPQNPALYPPWMWGQGHMMSGLFPHSPYFGMGAGPGTSYPIDPCIMSQMAMMIARAHAMGMLPQSNCANGSCGSPGMNPYGMAFNGGRCGPQGCTPQMNPYWPFPGANPWQMASAGMPGMGLPGMGMTGMGGMPGAGMGGAPGMFGPASNLAGMYGMNPMGMSQMAMYQAQSQMGRFVPGMGMDPWCPPVTPQPMNYPAPGRPAQARPMLVGSPMGVPTIAGIPVLPPGLASMFAPAAPGGGYPGMPGQPGRPGQPGQPGQGGQAGQGNQQTITSFPTHPFARSPRDFFMVETDPRQTSYNYGIGGARGLGFYGD